MKKLSIVCLALVVAMAFGFGTAFAENTNASAKATASVRDIAVLDWDPANWTGTNQGWTTILENTIKTANKKDLFIDVSLECGLYTDTLVKSKGGDRDTAMSDAGVMVRVLLFNEDGTVFEEVASPGEIVFARRTQTLSAVFGGILSDDDINCTTDCGTTCAITCETGAPPNCTADCTTTCTTTCTIDYATVEPEELELILQTMNANSFNFIVLDVGPGVHTVRVEAKIELDSQLSDAAAGKAEAKALIGNGSVTIEEVRMIKDEVIEF